MVTESFSPVACLFVPGDRPDRFGKAAASGANAVILDLEDAVVPEAKSRAREAIAARDRLSCPVIVRINAADTPWFSEDAASLAANPPDAVMLAKAERTADLARLRSVLGETVKLVPQIETARALADLDMLLGAEGVAVAAFGSLDFALDLGCEHEWEALLLARSELVLRSRLAGRAPPIDGVTVVLDDPAVVESDARRARSLGFGGKLAIHPAQIAPIRAAFAFSQKEIDWAERVTSAITGGAAQRVDDKMIDRPVIERAKQILVRSSRPF